MSTASTQWARALADALAKWCLKEGYQPRNRLAEEIGIPPTIWQKISAGSSVTQPEFYAMIFLRTGLNEADPRKIPPKIGRAPKKPEPFQVKRNWSETQWQVWMSKQPQAPSPHRTEEVQISENHQTIGSIVDALIEALIDDLAEKVALKVLAKQRSISGSNSEDITQLFPALVHFLSQRVRSDTEVGELMKRHGATVLELRRLLSLVAAESKARRRDIQLQDEESLRRQGGS